MAESQGLGALEELLNEFFVGPTGNERKHEIEIILTKFGSQSGAWKQCLSYLTISSNQYVCMFCLTIIENVINRQWIGLPWEERSHLKSLIYSYLVEKNSTLPICVKNKIVKVIVDIARIDWPHFYPEFFVNIMQLVQQPNTQSLGLTFLLTTSEELVSPREDLSFERKTELRKLLSSHIPQVFNILSDFLNNRDILKHPQDCSLVLKVFSHLFSWVPASQVPVSTVDSIFRIAELLQDSELSLTALSTLNEMLYRNWIPPNWNQFFQNSLNLLRVVMLSSMDDLDPSYVEKFSEFLRLLLAVHISHPELYQRLPLQELLSAILTYTVKQPTLDPGFLSCLEIWNHILDNPIASKYSDLFISLAHEILNKIQFRMNASQLDELSEVSNSGNDDTDWKRFLNVCIETIAKIADLDSIKILCIVYELWIDLCNHYSQISDTNIPNDQDQQRLHFIVRDLSTFTQAMGRLQPFCSDSNWQEESRYSVAQATVKHLLTLSSIARNFEGYSFHDTLKVEFMNVHAQVLAALKTWCYWIPLLLETDATTPLYNDLVLNIIETSVKMIAHESTVPMLQHCAVHLLFTLTNTVRPKFLWDYQSFTMLYTYDLSRFPKEDRSLLEASLTNSLVLPWPKTEDQLWDLRLKHLSNYMNKLTESFVNVPFEYNLQHKPGIINTLQSLTNVISMYKTEGAKSKKVLCLSIQKSVEHSLDLLRVYSADGEVREELLSFFLALLECLQHEVGVPFTQVTVQTLMNVYTKEQLQLSLQQESGGGIQQLLQILDFIIQTPGLAATKLTPVAITMCIQLSEPLLSDNASPSLQESLFQLIYSLLLHKASYFSKETSDQEQRIREFLVLLKAIGQSLLLPNINLFRQNLKNLESLNIKWRLYGKLIFQQELCGEFLNVLFKTLITKSHTLLNEEIATAIYSLISADFDGFFTNFLPNFLEANTILDTSQKASLMKNFTREQDLPSVIQNIFRLVNDLNCYQYYNTSLQPSSASL